MKSAFIYILIFAIPFPVNAQRRELPEGEEEREVADTAPAIVRTWRLIEDFTTIQDYHLDTMQTGFQIYNPVYRNSISNAYLGNIGLQNRNNIYFDEDKQPDFFFLRPYIPYLYTPEKTVYFNITKPFTMLEYFTSAGVEKQRREEIFRAVHTQNVNPFINLGLDLRLISSGGKYNNQKASLTNFTFFGSYTGKDYSVHSGIHFNGFQAQENGGLRNDSIFIRTEQDPSTYEVHLNEADSRTRSLNYHFTQRYRFGRQEEIPDTTTETGFRHLRSRTAKTGSLIHTLEFERDYRLYKDPAAGSAVDFYPNYFIDPEKTFDSTFYRSLTNTLQLMLDENPNRKNDFGARAFVSHDWVRYAFNIAPDSIFEGGDTTIRVNKAYVYNDLHLGASLLHTVGKGWSWIFAGRFYPLGYRAGDLVLSGQITRMFYGNRGESRIQITGKLSTREADHFLQHYESNHYRWNNDFRKTKDIRGSLLISNEAFSLSASADVSLVSGLIYFNQQATPSQHNPAISIIGLNIDKKFKLGPFHSVHKLYYQINTNKDVVRIPDLSYRSSDYFAFSLAKEVLTVEIGFDFYYYTKYRGLAFSPSSGIFYNQEQRQIGNYPYLNLFLTAKLKRTRFYIRWDHIYAGQIEKKYFHVLNSPMPDRVFRFGLSWTFYD